MAVDKTNVATCYYWFGRLPSDSMDTIVIRTSMSIHKHDILSRYKHKSIKLRCVASKYDERLTCMAIIFKDKLNDNHYIAPSSLLKSSICQTILSNNDGRSDIADLLSKKCTL